MNTLAAPTNLRTFVPEGSSGTVELDWAAVPGTTSYQVLRGTRLDNLAPVFYVAATADAEGRYVDTGLVNELTYYYAVRAASGTDLSPPSAPEFATPRNLTAVPYWWPAFSASYVLQVHKAWGAEGEDPRWLHLHHGHATAANEDYVGLRTTIWNADEFPQVQDPFAHAGIEVRYTVRSVPVSDWLPLPADFTLSVAHDDATPELAAIPDGISDVSVEVRIVGSGAANLWDYTVRRSFLHMTRHNAPISPFVPSLSEPVYYGPDNGPGVVYVDTRDLKRFGHPADYTTTPWTEPPHEANLTMTMRTPHAGFFSTAPLLWQDPPHPGQPFIRGWEPVRGQHYGGDSLRVQMAHEKFPILDGPRGVGWASPYISGSVDDNGYFYFAESQGAIRCMSPDGYLHTIVGWVYPDNPGLPVWPTKPLSTIRQFQEFRGRWLNGLDDPAHQGDNRGMHTPMDVAVDPRDPYTLYVTALEDHCIWRIKFDHTWAATVDVFVGDPYHTPGYADAQGHAARFNAPFSLVWKLGATPADDRLYITDHENDCIRAADRAGNVTTFAGAPGQGARIAARTLSSPYGNQGLNRWGSRFADLTATEPGVPHVECYKPQTIRTDSWGRLHVMDLGFGSIRRLDPDNNDVALVVNVWQKFPGADEFGWAWFDIDKWGNSGPLDGIYWCKSNGQDIEGDDGGAFGHFNEVYAWSPSTGGGSRFFLADRWSPWAKGWGPVRQAQGPHYPWLIAVDPRGGVLLAGFGANGLSFVRGRRSTDPTPTAYYPGGYYDARAAWTQGAPGSPVTPRPLDVSRSLALAFGLDAHNYLGLPDGWDLTGAETDDELFQLFQVPPAIRTDAAFRGPLLEYLRQSRAQ